MKFNNRLAYSVILSILILSGLFIWLTQRPVKIIAVHEDGHYSSVLVEQFPITDKGKINWWLQNKNILQKIYGIPNPSSWGYFNVMFWDFGDGYKKQDKYDRLCFDDMKTEKRCVDKNKIFSVERDRNGDTLFTINDGRYRMNENGEVVRLSDE
ncbi:DUF943 family protein [Kosakonia sp. SMBL-WEM22]|uniref:DUF943 family protein n=1 Tax=Kosakonia sp. SMBL-WEM22 TaxID=2725560 RepID=UPI0016595509|nr:DUF943 family protein [Kosakonia sp. SMBL-WEM22]QNQ19042.1 DUF943 family protein [Kosakonia sp. SMBL-WEM22]